MARAIFTFIFFWAILWALLSTWRSWTPQSAWRISKSFVLSGIAAFAATAFLGGLVFFF